MKHSNVFQTSGNIEVPGFRIYEKYFIINDIRDRDRKYFKSQFRDSLKLQSKLM